MNALRIRGSIDLDPTKEIDLDSRGGGHRATVRSWDGKNGNGAPGKGTACLSSVMLHIAVQ